MSVFLTKLGGGFELFFLFGRGIGKFSGTPWEAWRSLTIPLGTLLFGLMFQALFPYPPKGMETGFGMGRILATVAVHAVLTFGLTTGFVWLVAWSLNMRDRFPLYFVACNWAGLAGFIIGLPLSMVAAWHLAPREVMDRVFVIWTLYGVFVSTCVTRASLRINWQLAAGIAIGCFSVGNELMHVLYVVQGLPPNPWGY